VVGNSGSCVPHDLRPSDQTEKGFDTDQTFLLGEIAGDEFHFRPSPGRTDRRFRYARPPESSKLTAPRLPKSRTSRHPHPLAAMIS